MKPPRLHEITTFLDQELQVRRFADSAFNGLQVQGSRNTVRRLAVAVDAGLSVVQEAIAADCDLLIVHHGIMWGQIEPVVGALARKLHALLAHGLSLYAAHLPLDGHPTLGNAAQLAQLLGAVRVTPCFEHRGATIGVQAEFEHPRTLDQIIAQVSSCDGALTPPFVLPFGRRMVQRIGIATGAATSCLRECAQLGLDLLLTGEPKQEAYHTARELECSLICMGHYASETFGVRAVERILHDRFGVETVWINQPTGI